MLRRCRNESGVELMNYAELFAGAGGFREGIEQAEGTANCVYANELDRHAAAVYRHRYGELVEGDIREQSTTTIPDIDFLAAGFPCQSFSLAGKRLGLQDTRGTLFFEVARVLADKRPGHFLLENVKGLLSNDGGKTFQVILRVLSDIGYRVEWEVLNSTCWVPQNRERVFIIGHSRTECGCQVFPLREDDGIYPEPLRQETVANCLDSNYSKGWLDKGQRTMIAETAYTKSNRKASRVRLADAAGNLDSGASQAVSVPILYHQNKSKTVTPHDEAQALRAGASHSYQGVGLPVVGQRFRRLTPLECERLQGWQDNHTALGLYLTSTLPKSKRSENEYTLLPVSDTNRYKMTGNGVTADVVREIVKKMIMRGCFDLQ